MATTVYKRTALTGGGANALDSIDGNDLLDGDFAYTMVGTTLYIHELDDDSGLAESSPGIIAPDSNPGNKRWIQKKLASDNATPEGVIVAFIGGYFSNSSNGTFVDVLGNSVSAVNTLLNGDGWYVCDGSELNLATSTIFNGSGRYLPNLTDSRFIAGSTTAGSTGGSNTQSHTHATSDHTLTIDEMPEHKHTASTGSAGSHSHSITGTMVGDDGGAQHSGPGTYNDQSFSTGSAGSHTHSVSIGNEGGDGAHNHGDTAASSADNRPQFLNCLYIMKVS